MIELAAGQEVSRRPHERYNEDVRVVPFRTEEKSWPAFT